MDPTANLEEQKRLHAKRHHLTEDEKERWLELKEALTGWKMRGGFMPPLDGIGFYPMFARGMVSQGA